MNSLQKSQEIKNKFINNSNILISKQSKHTSTSTIDNDERVIYLEKGDLPTDFSIIEESFNNPDESINASLNYLSSLLQPTQRTVEEPNQRPTEEPNQRPTEEPNQRPTEEPNQRPVEEPTQRRIEEPNQRSITAYISIYLINESRETINPFFQYFFIWDEETKTANFPKKIINLPISLNSDNENSTEYIQTQIFNECIEYILEVFDLYEGFDTSLLDEMFKGFIWNSKVNTVHLFFNVSLKNPNKHIEVSKNINQPDDSIVLNETPILFKWAILDEIINKQYIENKSVPIFPEIVNLFKENTFLNTIYISAPDNNLKKIPIEYPLCLYMCRATQPNSPIQSIVWENVLNNNEDIIENTIDFQPLGDYYYFSSTPLNSNSPENVTSQWEKDYLKKYAVFLNINNGKYSSEESYIVKDISTITKEQWDNYAEKINQTDVSTIWFKENGLQLWAIKYPSQFCSII